MGKERKNGKQPVKEAIVTIVIMEIILPLFYSFQHVYARFEGDHIVH